MSMKSQEQKCVAFVEAYQALKEARLAKQQATCACDVALRNFEEAEISLGLRPAPKPVDDYEDYEERWNGHTKKASVRVTPELPKPDLD